jgi:tetratricopeptide (TPR) repeat protein/O-antigen ligase
MTNRISRFCDGVMEAAWLMALIFAPLYFNIYSSRVFEPDKITLVRSLALVALAAWGVKVLSEGKARFDNVPVKSLWDFLRVPMVLPVGLLIVVYLIATVFSVAPQATLFGSYQRLQGTFSTFSYLALAAALMANLRQRAQAERLITTVIITSLPIAFYGILQRFRLDPLPWGGDTVDRVTANMGNAIFLGAYLIMAAMLTLGRIIQSFHSILRDEDTEQLIPNIVRAAIYIFIFALNVLAIFWSGSRGPWLGMAAGLFAFFVFLSLYWRVRWLTLTTLGVSALLGVFLIVLNIPNGPLESVRQMPGIGRLGQVFETEGGTGRVRTLIWGGVVQMMLPHLPIASPDGQPDVVNAVRPLIGYGPEALYVAYNRFYPPELGQLEARNASPDRSHNETFDALAFTGLFGLLAYLTLFVSVFYYGMKWQGLITSARQRWAFSALVLGGGVAGAAGMVQWRGVEFFGVGLPFGMLLGLIAFIGLFALVAMPRLALAAETTAEGTLARMEIWRGLALISLFSAIVAHFTEIHFGIAIASTRTHFWLFTALLVVLGFVFPRLHGVKEPEKVDGPGKPTSARARLREDQSRRARRETTEAGDWLPVLLGASLLSVILITLGYDFITNSQRTNNAAQILASSFAQRPGRAGEPQWVNSYGVLGLMFMTWLAGGLTLFLEETLNRPKNRWVNVAAGLGVSLIGGFIGWLVISSYLAGIVGLQVTSLETLLRSVESVAGVVSLFYILMLMLLAGLGSLLGFALLPRQGRLGAATHSVFMYLGLIVLPIAAVVGSVTLNLQVIQADIVYKTGLQFDDSGQPEAAIKVYERALALAPSEDYYYLFLGRAYLNATNSQQAQQDQNLRNQYLLDAEMQLKKARLLNPLNTDHTANLARLSRQWAAIAADPATRETRLEMADNYYAQALSLSPNNAGLWNERAALEVQMRSNLLKAQEYISASMALDTTYDQTYQLQGDLYATQARSAADPAAQKALFEQALAVYQQGLIATEKRGGNQTAFLVNIASIQTSLGLLADSINTYTTLVARNDPGISKWQVYLQISQLYYQLGDINQARSNAELALQAAPDEDSRNTVNGWLSQFPPAPSP